MANLLMNPGFEEGWWRKTFSGQSYGEIFVPEHWVAYWREGTPVLHDPSNQTGYGRPEMHVINREAPFLDPLRVRSGSRAVKFFTFYRIHDAGLYQQISGVEPGTRVRGTGWAHAWSSMDDDPRTSEGAGDEACFVRAEDYHPAEGAQETGIRNVTFVAGIDPEGGTDPWAESVVWGEGAHIYNAFAQIPPVETVAESDTVTFFVRSSVLWPFKHCDAYLDDMRLVCVDEPVSPPEVRVVPDQVVVGEPFAITISGGRGPEHIVVTFSDSRVFQKPVTISGDRASCQCVATAPGDYEARVALGSEAVEFVAVHVVAPSRERGQDCIPPRVGYERTYLLMPPSADGAWLAAVRRSGVWDRYRWTIGGSADDAGIGPLDRRVIAVNPESWPSDLKAFFDEYYPGIDYVALTVATPEALEAALRDMS